MTMRFRAAKISLAIFYISIIAVAWMFSARAVEAQGAGSLTPQEERGKRIYLKGESDGGEIIAVLGSSDLELPASSFACSNCHGLRGEGSKEGGLQPPPINWASLSVRQTSPLTRRERAPYTDATLARAITAGIDSSGGRLHPGMPHYKMSATQMADLIAYLKRIGSDADSEPGLSDDKIRIGAALPVTGALAKIGEDVKAALEAYFTEANAQGGVYGRRIELVVEDSRGTPSGTAEAIRTLVDRDGVFALVGSFEPVDSDVANEFLEKREVPLVGSITLSPRLPAVPNRYIFYLLPGYYDQARSLVEFIGSEQTRPKGRGASRLAVVHSNSAFDLDALAGLRFQAKRYSMQIIAEQSYEAGRLSAEETLKEVAANKPDYIFFFGNGDDFMAFARAMSRIKLEAGLLTSAIMVGRTAFNMPSDIASRAYLSYPGSLPDADSFSEFLAVMQKSNVELRSVAFQAVAYAAGKVFLEAAKSSGRNLSRAEIINSLERLQSFKTGVLPPVTFGPNRRIGATISYIVGLDLTGKRYVPISDSNGYAR